MSDLKIGDTIIFKDGPGYRGVVVAFSSDGVYSTQGEFAVIASASNPLAGPHTTIHCSLLRQPDPDSGPVAF